MMDDRDDYFDDLNMHPMRDSLPTSDPPDDDGEVCWKASQPLFAGAEQQKWGQRAPKLKQSDWLYPSQPVASASSGPASSSGVVLPTTRWRPAHANKGKTQATRASASKNASVTSPAQIASMIKLIAKGADENSSNSRPSSRAGTTKKIGVKERTMNLHRQSPMGTRATGSSKGKSREPAALVRNSSIKSSLSSSTSSMEDSLPSSGDTIMTSPEPDTRQGLMPPPPVPHNRVFADEQLTSNAVLPSFPRPSAQSTPPRARRSNSRNAPQQSLPRLQFEPSQRPAEPILHPLLQQKASAKPTPPPTTPPLVPQLSQSQPEQRRAPPALGMRRTKTAPLAVASSNAPSASQAARKFRSPLVNGGAQTKSEPAKSEHPEPKLCDVSVTAETPTTPSRSSPPQPRSSPSNGSISFDFEPEELEKVMSTYD
ncbi:hypothetical protein FB45DRAFT_1006475 [Roridomyces roridus]|uniref:Uncharacterized protein n=1 Tax=Roridomyces roridus TaxID=1738132 RepID=A0AAD7FIL9_9AGAR|nr:hypothetical protein FB45DRAFT_1006475 [Roridomyces roridus]